MKNTIIQSFSAFVGEKKNSDLWSPYEKADILAGDMFGAMGLFRLSDIELDQIIDLKKADKLAKKMFGEFGFATLAAKEMEELIDANPKLLRESLVNEAKTISFAKASMLGSKLLNKIKIGTILDTKGGQYEVTGFGQQSNAFKEFEATIDGKEVKVKLTAMYGLKLEVTDDVRSARFNKEEEINSIILESLITEAKIKVTKNEWPYLEFKVGGKKHKVDFDYEDIIDDHGNEGQDQYWLGKDDEGQEWMIDVYANYMGDVEEVHYDTIVKESVVTEKLAKGLKPLLTTGTTITKNDGEDALLNLSDQFDKIDDEYAGTIASWLDMAIELMQDGYSGDATKKLKQFNKACKDVLKGKEIGSAFESTVTEAKTSALNVQDERHFGKKGIIIMIDDNGVVTSAIFKDKKNADKYDRNNMKDLEALLKLAKDTKYPQAIDEHEFDKKNWGQVASTHAVAETFSIFLDSSLNEGKWSKIMKGVRKGAKAGPWAIVSIENGKVVNQDLVSIMDAIPAHYEAVKKEFPNAKLSIEDNEGHIVYNESMINEKKYVAPKTYDNTKNWEKEGSRFRYIPFDDFKSRQVGKPDFKTPDMSDVEVEQWFTQISGQCDGRLQAKILKGFDKHGDKYKQSGDNMETYKSWIIDAMVRCGFMVEGKIQLPVSEKFYFGKKDKFNDNDINDVYGFYGTLDTLYDDEQRQEFWINTFNYLISSFGFTDEGALYFLNAKIGRWLADQFADSNVTMGNDGVFDVIDNFAKSSQWKRWAKEYNEFAIEDMTNESVVYETFDNGLNEDKSSTEILADDVSGELYTATLKGKSVTITATTTTKEWDDGVPVLKYLARGRGKSVRVELNRSFDVVHDVAHGWFYFTDGRKWYGMHQGDGYGEADDLPFNVVIKESKMVKEAKMDRDDFIDHLQTKFSLTFVSTTEEFNGSEGGVWVSGEDRDTYKGKIIYDYYTEDHKNYELGVLNKFEQQINKFGWYSEWYDAGTVMIWPL